MLKQTALNQSHKALNARLVDFFGWELPLHYGSQIEEHHAVRQHAGIFDVSHMGVVDLIGPDALSLLRYALSNDAAKLVEEGMALYSCMLNAEAGIIDDLIVYRMSQGYRIIWNAGKRDSNLAHLQSLQEQTQADVIITPQTDLGIIALQGPQAIAIAQQVFDNEADTQRLSALKPFRYFMNGSCMVSATGYTGELGVELVFPNEQLPALWQACLDHGARACGLGARDSLRLEAGYNLSGQDMDETTTPLESNLAWTIDWKDEARDFIGKKALLEQKQQGCQRKLVGLLLLDKGVMRHGQTVQVSENEVGEVTSGGFSPTLNRSIALARVPMSAGSEVTVARRGQWLAAQVTRPAFVKQGQILIEGVIA